MVLLRSLSLDEKGGPSLLPEPADTGCEDEQPSDRSSQDGYCCSDSGLEQKRQQEPAPVEEASAFLPDQCVKLIQAQLIANEPPGVALLHLLSMSSVCRQWRTLASELAPGIALAFDCFDSVFPSQLSVQLFRKLTSAQKESVLCAAARLLHGYQDVTLSGEGVSDRVLQELGLKNGVSLHKCKVSNSGGVTDTGLSTLVSHAKGLQTLHVEELSKPNTGRFLALLFEQCEQLASLSLINVPGLSWAQCKAAAATWADKPALTKLALRMAHLDAEFGMVLSRLPNLRELELDGPAVNIKAAALACPLLTRVSYTVGNRQHLDEALAALMTLKELRQLELIVKNFTLCPEQLRVIGMLPLVELNLDSFIYKQQPTLSRSSYSHVDNEGVKALVDSICNRWCAMGAGEMRPLKLSLCGASALTHDAVSALLRLPILTELNIGGCARIIAMDKMRLVAKVRAGRELLDSARRPTARTSRFPGLMMYTQGPH